MSKTSLLTLCDNQEIMSDLYWRENGSRCTIRRETDKEDEIDFILPAGSIIYFHSCFYKINRPLKLTNNAINDKDPIISEVSNKLLVTWFLD